MRLTLGRIIVGWNLCLVGSLNILSICSQVLLLRRHSLNLAHFAHLRNERLWTSMLIHLVSFPRAPFTPMSYVLQSNFVALVWPHKPTSIRVNILILLNISPALAYISQQVSPLGQTRSLFLLVATRTLSVNATLAHR